MPATQTDRPAASSHTPVPGTHPVLRLLPAPASDPPYDDERPASQVALRTAPVRLVVAPSLHLVAPGAPGRQEVHDDARPVDRAGTRPVPVPSRDWDGEDDVRRRTPLAGLAPARPFAHALVQRVLEVLAGVRPVSQLQRHTTPELFERLEQVVAAQPRCAGPRPDGRAVRSVRVQAWPEGVAEACATVRRQTPRGVRVQAVALRLEGLEGRWCCTELVGL